MNSLNDIKFRDYLFFVDIDKYKKSNKTRLPLCHIRELCDYCQYYIKCDEGNSCCIVMSKKNMVR